MSGFQTIVSERLGGPVRPGSVQWTSCPDHPHCARLTIVADPAGPGEDYMTYPSITAHVDRGDVRYLAGMMVGAFCDNAQEHTTKALGEKAP